MRTRTATGGSHDHPVRYDDAGNFSRLSCEGARDAKLPAAIASRLLQFQSAWTRLLARRRLARSIAHLDDRLLADIGLSSQDLGFAERNDHCSSRPCDAIFLRSG